MERFAGWVLKYRLPLILLTLALTGASIYSLVRWARVESDISKYLPKDDPVVMRFTEAGERFGGVTVAMTAVEFDEVFRPEAIATIDRLTREFKKVPGVSWVVSLTSIDDVKEKVIDGEKVVAVGKLIDPEALPRDPAELQQLKSYVMGKEELVGVVVSADGRLANIAASILEGADRAEVAAELERRAREIAGNRTLYFSGFPNWMKTTAQVILRDLGRLVPIVSLVVILVLFLSFRSLRGVLLPLSAVLVSSSMAMGLMSAIGWPITMLSNVIPVLMMALGTAYAIHLLHRYHEVTGAGPINQGALQKSLVDVFVPILGAGVTTIVGFLSFLTTSLSFIRHTGWIAAFGITVAMVLTLTTLPAVISYLRPIRPRFDHTGQRARRGLGSAVDKMGLAVIGHRRLVVAVSVLICVGFAALIPRIEHRFNMVEYFPPASDVRKADEMMRTKLGGNTPIWVTADGEVKDPYVLRSMILVGKFLSGIPDVHNVRSIATLVAEMNQVMTGHSIIPETREGVGNLWLNLEGKEVLNQMVDREQKHALVQAMCETADTGRLRRLQRAVDDFLRARIPEKAVRVSLPNADPALTGKARGAILDTAALMVTLDLEARVRGQNLRESEVRGWIQAGPEKETAKLRSLYTQRFQDYLRSEESELELSDAALVDRLAGEASELVSGGVRDEPALSQALLAALIQPQKPGGAPARNAPESLEDTRESVPQLARSLLVVADEVDGESRVEQALTRILQHLPQSAPADTRLLRELRGDLWELNARTAYLPGSAVPAGQGKGEATVRLQQTGIHQVSVSIDDGVVFSQLSSLFFAVVVALVFIIVQFRSIVAGLLGMIPMVFTLLINFGVMGALKIELEPATVLIASVVVGVGVDYPIHLLSRLKLELGWQRGNLEAAVDGSLRSAGRAILINAFAVMGGMLVFLFGELIPLHYFGGMMALAMVSSSLTAVTVLPAAIVALRPKFLTRSTEVRPPDLAN